MHAYTTGVFLHVLAVIFGVGPLGALAVMSCSPAPAVPAERLARLHRLVGCGLATILVTGLVVVHQAHGALGGAGWVRASLALFGVLGVLHGLVRRRLTRRRDAGMPRGVRPLLWAMCALVAAITYLMEAKPW